MIFKLVNSDYIIGNPSKDEKENIVVENPYTIKDLGQGPCVMPYDLDLLTEPMKFIAFQPFNVLWFKSLSEFPQVQKQYITATTGIEIEDSPKLEL